MRLYMEHEYAEYTKEIARTDSTGMTPYQRQTELLKKIERTLGVLALIAVLSYLVMKFI